MRNGLFNELNNFGIAGLILQAKVTKFGTYVGLNMFINISSGFYHNRKRNWQFFYTFSNLAHLTHWPLGDLNVILKM